MAPVPHAFPVEAAEQSAYWAARVEEQEAILDAVSIAIGLARDRKIVWVNQGFTTVLGYSREQAGTLPTATYFHDVPQFEAAMREADVVLAQGRSYQRDLVMRRKDGELFWGSVSGRLLNPEHPDAGTVWTLKDISERKRVEETLKLTQSRLEDAQEQAKTGSWELGADFEARYWSKEMYALLGFDPALGLPRTVDVHESVHPEDRASWEESVRRALATGERTHLEFRSNPTRGPLRYFEATLRAVLDEQGKLSKVFGTTQDVTERVQDKEALKLSQARLERAQAQAKIGSWEHDPATQMTYFSNEMYVLLDRDPHLGPPVADEGIALCHPEEYSRLNDTLKRAAETDCLVTLEHRGLERVGEPQRYFETTMAAVRDSEGKLLHFAGTLQDVTERRLAAAALRDSERRLQRLLENSSDLIVVLDVDGMQRSLRGPVRSMLGYEPAELDGAPALGLMHPDDIPAATHAIAESIAHPGVPYRLEYRLRHKQGGWVELEAVGTNWLDDPMIRGIVVNVRQITERKQSEREHAKLQAQLQQAAKMEAVGRLAGGIAHDFNNLLTVISGNVELAQGELHANDPMVQHLNDVGAAAASAASLTRQLLAFSRRQLIEPKVVNLNDLIGSLRNMLDRLLGEDVKLELLLARDLGAVRIDPGQFDQVIVNLAVNARDAMPKGGRLTIETANIELDDDYCRMHREISPGAFVSLAVTDNGEGMSAETLSHIFEPFFSTKLKGKGTGLGLSVTFGAVKQVGGTIEAYSELGLGTTFKIYLPRTDSPVQSLTTAKATLEALHGTETILLVEDDDRVRGLTSAMLRRLGYQLVVAANGKSALALVQTEHPPIDLLLTDLVMPEMSGRELSDKLRVLCPTVAVLYCSGYTEDSFVRHGLGAKNLQFIGKPFTLQQLGLKVREVLGERSKTTKST